MVFGINFAEVVANIVASVTHLPPSELIIFDIAIILIISAILALIAKFLKQPLIPAYVLAGLIIGPLALGLISNFELITAFSEIGIAFLLFIAGLEISFKKIKEANIKNIALVGLLQVGIIVGAVFLLKDFLNLDSLQAAYIGVIIAFGSTMVDVKLLADRGELVTLHGRLVLGILLFQDLVAVIAIIVFTTGSFATTPLLIAFSKLLALVLTATLLQKFLLNKLFKFAARSTELLFLTSLATLFFFIIFAYFLEVSIVIGAFIAGVSLANSPFKIELESRISPLRDFFAILFFVALGMQIVFAGVGEKFLLFTLLIFGALIIKPLLTFVLLRITGYRPKTSFVTAISLAQLSEFSLIIGMLGVTLGVLSIPIFSAIILATIITMSITPYFIDYKDFFYRIFKSPLGMLKFLPLKENLEYSNSLKKEILLIGAHRMGGVVLKKLMKRKDELLVIDYNPKIIGGLIDNKISCIYGDVTSPELLDKINTKDLKLVISTAPGFKENVHLLRKMKNANKRIKVVVTGGRISETLELYEEDADYVITPKVLAGQELARIIHPTNLNFKKAKKVHLKHLENIHKLLY